MPVSSNIARIVVLATAAIGVSACATKDFGRMELSPIAGYSCEELAAEQVKVDEFRAVIDEKDDFDGRSLVAVTLLDFGYGNMRDKQQAVATADAREAQINGAMEAQGCS